MSTLSSNFHSPKNTQSTIHWPLIVVVLLLSGIGVMMMISAGGGEWSVYAKGHIIKLIVALGLMAAIAAVPLRLIFASAYLFYGFVFALLIYVEIAGHIGMGAQRWIAIGPIALQPSEFMKLALILVLARYFHGLRPEDISRIRYVIPPLLFMALPVILILKQPNLGTAAIICIISVSLLFIAGLSWRYFAGAALTLSVLAPIGWQFLHGYQQQRVLTFLDPESDPLGAGYNVLQSMIAIGSGGFWGTGYLKGSQGQLNFLPEKHTDFVFTMFAEEWGFMGSIILLILFATLLAMSGALIVQSKNLFSKLVAAGITTMLFAHIFINMGMVMGLMPVTGLPLPFLSFGGSILISVMLATGLLINLYKHRHQSLALHGTIG